MEAQPATALQKQKTELNMFNMALLRARFVIVVLVIIPRWSFSYFT